MYKRATQVKLYSRNAAGFKKILNLFDASLFKHSKQK